MAVDAALWFILAGVIAFLKRLRSYRTPVREHYKTFFCFAMASRREAAGENGVGPFAARFERLRSRAVCAFPFAETQAFSESVALS